MGDMKLTLPAAEIHGTLFAAQGQYGVRKVSKDPEADLQKVAEGFESFLMRTMLNEMEKTTGGQKKSYMAQTYMSVLYERLGDYVAKKGIGIKDMITKQLDAGNVKVAAGRGDNIGK